MYSTRMYTCICVGRVCWGGHGTLQGATPSQIAGRRCSRRRRRREGLACLGVDAPRLPVRLPVRSVDLLARLYPLRRHERGAPRHLVLLEGGVELGRVEVVVDVAR